MHRFGGFHWFLLALVLIGAINWGLVGLFGFDLVAALFGEMSGLSRVIYTLVGLAGVGLLISEVSHAPTHRKVEPYDRISSPV